MTCSHCRAKAAVVVFLFSTIVATVGAGCAPATVEPLQTPPPVTSSTPTPDRTPAGPLTSSPASSPTPAPTTPTPTVAASLIIDHRTTDISKIPLQWIDQAKSGLRILYYHSSHGNQITVGMENLIERYGARYDANESGKGGALSYQDVWADLGTRGDLTWADTTRDQLKKADNDRNVVIWSWCGGVTENTRDGIDRYLTAMSQLEKDYPKVRFVYMTGHLDGSGESGKLSTFNNQIRQWCKANNKILYDFADIESYDPDGNYFLDRNADADCSYTGGNWAEEWSARHPDSELSGSGYFEHTHVLNCNLKARAFWWLLARLRRLGWSMNADSARSVVRELMLRFNGGSFRREYAEAKLDDTQRKYLRLLLLHAYHCVPYYHRVFDQIGLVKNNDVDLSKFGQIPVLTKATMGEHWDQMISSDYRKRRWYYNSSGGSTGEPLRLIQDDRYARWGNAAFHYWYQDILGIDEPSTKKVIVWGSERDLLQGGTRFRGRMFNWLNNTIFLNAFSMSERDMGRFIDIINSYQPALIRGYAGSLYQLGKYAERNGLKVHRPKMVVSSAELLTEHMRSGIEGGFGAKVYDFYGSREANNIAGECKHGLMHVFAFHNHVEILDAQGYPVPEGGEGRVILTNLHNWSMPLIRYQIGDTAVPGPQHCPCGNPLPVLAKLAGRITDNFVKEDGTVVHGEFFTHLFYFRDWVKAFRVIQEDYRDIRIVVHPKGVIDEAEKAQIEHDIRYVMGENTKIAWEFRYGIADARKVENMCTHGPWFEDRERTCPSFQGSGYRPRSSAFGVVKGLAN